MDEHVDFRGGWNFASSDASKKKPLDCWHNKGSVSGKTIKRNSSFQNIVFKDL